MLDLLDINHWTPLRNPTARPQILLCGVNLSLAAGEQIAVVAPEPDHRNGLIDVLTGTQSPSEGARRARGQTRSLTALAEGFLPRLSVAANLALIGGINHLDIDHLKARVVTLLGDEILSLPVAVLSDALRTTLATTVARALPVGCLVINHESRFAPADPHLPIFDDISVPPAMVHVFAAQPATLPVHDRAYALIGPHLIAADDPQDLADILSLAALANAARPDTKELSPYASR